jgi:hypothetical protein
MSTFDLMAAAVDWLDAYRAASYKHSEHVLENRIARVRVLWTDNSRRTHCYRSLLARSV